MVRLHAWLAGVAAALATATAAAQPADTPATAGAAADASDDKAGSLAGYQAGGLRIDTAPTRAAVQIAEPAIDQALTLKNQGPDALVELGGLASSRTRLATEWRRADGTVINAPVLLPRGGVLSVNLSAVAPQAGLYRSRLRLLDPVDRHELWVGYFALERRSALPTAGVLLPPGAPFEQAVGFWFNPADITFTLHNPTTATVSLERPQLLELRRETGGRTRAVFLGAADGRFACPAAEQPTGTLMLAPDASCRGVVKARIEGAGAYVAHVAVTGSDGGQAIGDVQVNVRLAWFWAALVTALGSLGGWLVGTFRRDWRARSLLAEAAALQRERLARIVARAQAIGLGEVTAPTLQAVDDLIQTIQQQSDLNGLAEQIAALGARIERLDRWQTLEAHIAGSADSDATKPARLALRDGLEDLSTPDAELVSLFAAVNQAARDAAPRDTLGGPGLAAAAPAPSSGGLDAPMIASRTSDAAALIASRRKHIELGVNAVAGVALVASAVQAVWANDPTWGDLSDVLGLMITAFAVQAGGSVALGQWTGAASRDGAPTTPAATNP